MTTAHVSNENTEFHFWRPQVADATVVSTLPKIAEMSKPLPMYELEDVMASTSTSQNKGLQWSCPCKFSGTVQKVPISVVEKEMDLGHIRGLKTPYVPNFDITLDKSKKEDRIRFNDAHVLNVMAEAPHGLHRTDAVVHGAMAAPDRKTGDDGHARRKGLEARQNRSTIMGPPTGVPLSVQPNLPTTDHEKINDKLVAPIKTFIS